MVPPQDPACERRLSRALAHVNSLWFPINPEILAKIQAGFADGSFTRDPDALLSLLKQDFALFTYVVKELIPIAAHESVAPRIICHPIELLGWAGADRIKSIINSAKGLPSTHSLHASEDFQTDRLRETAIIASTAEVLSEKKNLDPEMGFCRGVIREIGLNLIAWNYPQLYNRVIQDIPESSSLDEQLTRELGFSPTTLAMRIITPAHIPITSPEVAALDQEWEVYDSLCKVGEALAHAEHPDTYPSAETEWLSVRSMLIETVGSDGLAQIQKKAISNSKSYSQAIPETFRELQSFNPEKRVASHKKATRSEENRYLRHCAANIQDLLREIYAEMPDDSVNRKALERLVKEVIPQAGFTGGCVYVIDPASQTLSPRTMIGKVKRRAISTITLGSPVLQALDPTSSEAELIEAATDHIDAIANAFACVQPIIERDENLNEDSLTTISSSLGGKRRIGVLYLEKPSDASPEQDSVTVMTFKALRQALCDALHLE